MRPARSIAAVILTAAAAVTASVIGPSTRPAAAAPRAPSSQQLAVPLGTHRFGRLRTPDAIVAHAGPSDVGFWKPPNGGDGAPFGPWSFDVGRDGAVWLLDEVNDRLLVWQPGRADRPARTVPLPFKAAVDFALGSGGTLYVFSAPAGEPHYLYALTSTGQVRWKAPTVVDVFNAQLRMGPDGTLYYYSPGGAGAWTPLTTPAGRPLPLAEQRRRTSPDQPLAGGLRLATTDVSGHERRVALSNQTGQLLRAWRVTSQTDLGGLVATPALVGRDPVVALEVSQQTKAKFLSEYLVLRLAPAGGTRARFALDAHTVWGDTPITGQRVGPDGQLYQLRSDLTTGVSIARYSLSPVRVVPPPTIVGVVPHATAPSMAAPRAAQPAAVAPTATVAAPTATVPPAQQPIPAAPEPASRWIIPGLGALGTSALVGLSGWRLYRRRHPAGPSLQGRARMAH